MSKEAEERLHKFLDTAVNDTRVRPRSKDWSGSTIYVGVEFVKIVELVSTLEPFNSLFSSLKCFAFTGRCQREVIDDCKHVWGKYIMYTVDKQKYERI